MSNEVQLAKNGDLGTESRLLRWYRELLTSDDDDPSTPHYPLSFKARENTLSVFVGGAMQIEGSGDPATIDATIYGVVVDNDSRGITLTWHPDPGTGVHCEILT
jgi:hypothetical protein